MFKKPWQFKEGFLIGGILIVLGLILQAVAGPVDWSALAWPVNIILLAILLLVIDVMFLLRERIHAFGWMMHAQAAVPAIACTLGLTLLMGLTVQTDEGGIPGLSQMVTFWPFTLTYTWMVLIAGLTTLNRISRWKWRDIPFVINHLGVFLAVTCAALGSADLQQLEMTVREGVPQWMAEDGNGAEADPGLAIELHDFTIEEYPAVLALYDANAGRRVPDATLAVTDGTEEGVLGGWRIRILEHIEDAAAVPGEEELRYAPWNEAGGACAVRVEAEKDGTRVGGWVAGGSFAFPMRPLELGGGYSLVMPAREPRRYASDISVYTRDGQEVHGTVEVNKPLKAGGWKIYQASYDEEMGKWSEVSVFELVRDPWLPAVCTGIFLMLAGAACLFLLMAPKPVKKEV
jgi:hypothetical protein